MGVSDLKFMAGRDVGCGEGSEVGVRRGKGGVWG